MGKPIGLGPRLVAIQQAGITKKEAAQQIQAQAAAGVPPEQMVLTNPQTAVVVPLNIPAAQPQPIQETAPGKRGIDLTSLALGWNKLMDKLGLPSALKIALDSEGKAVLGQTYKTNQYDGTVDELAGFGKGGATVTRPVASTTAVQATKPSVKYPPIIVTGPNGPWVFHPKPGQMKPAPIVYIGKDGQKHIFMPRPVAGQTGQGAVPVLKPVIVVAPTPTKPLGTLDELEKGR